MNINDALRIMNLDINYTDDDLKREYRKLVTKYHPDKHCGKDKKVYEEKTKLLNTAKEILAKNLKDKTKKKEQTTGAAWSNASKDKYDNMHYSDIEELSRLKRKYKEELNDELDYIYDVNARDNLFMKWKDRFLELIYDFFLCIDDQPDTFFIKAKYNIYKEQYYELLCYYLYDCWKNSKITIFAGNLNIDMNDGLKSVRTKMIMFIINILNNELDEFKMVDDYYDIEPLLLGLRNGFADLCLWGYINIEKAKIDFKNKIVLELKKYNRRKEIIDNLTKYYGFPNKLVINLHNNILNEEKFNSLYNDGVDTKTKIRVKIKNIFSR